VLRHHLGKLEEAEGAYRLALAESGSTEEDFKAQDITTLYNLGRLYEAQNRQFSFPNSTETKPPAHANVGTQCNEGQRRRRLCTKQS